MARKLLIVALLCMPLFLQADQRVWLDESGDYYDPANPWHRKTSYLDLPLPEADGLFQARLYYADGQVALEGLSPTPEFDRKTLLGEVVEYYPDGQVSIQASYVTRDQVCDCGHNHPVLHGPYKSYHPNGQLHRSLTYYGGGVMDGDYTEYDVEGQVTRRYSMKNYRYHGGYAEYRNGQLIKEENYHEGHRLGEQKTYYSDGRLQRTYIASDFYSQPVGEDLYYRGDGSLSRKIWRVLDDNGQVAESREEYFEADERLVRLVHKVGDWQLEEEYSQEGELTGRRERDKNGLQGLWLASNYTGISEKVNYQDGKRHGLYQRFDENGEPVDVIHYENGQKHGPADYRDGYGYGYRVVTRYYKDEPDGDYLETTDDGRIIRQGQYLRGKPEGVHYQFSEVGQMLKKQSYREGEAHGEWIEMGYDGITVIRKHYENGTLISEGEIIPEHGLL